VNCEQPRAEGFHRERGPFGIGSNMMFKKVHLFGFLLIGLIFPAIVQSQAIPFSGMKLKLVPRYKDVAGEIGSKSVTVYRTKKGIKVVWYSLVKDFDEEAYYPTYKIKSRRGIIETDGLDLKTAFFLPHLWGNGYIRSETALPLWLDPEYLSIKGKQKRSFNSGLLNSNRYLLKMAPDELFDKLNFFQNLYDQYVTGMQVRTDIRLSKKNQRELRKFVKNFFLVKKIAKTKATIYVNKIKESYPSLIIGNEYFHFVVIDDPLNPLVVNFKIFPDKAPKVFRKSFKLFKKNFEYMITQVTY